MGVMNLGIFFVLSFLSVNAFCEKNYHVLMLETKVWFSFFCVNAFYEKNCSSTNTGFHHSECESLILLFMKMDLNLPFWAKTVFQA